MKEILIPSSFYIIGAGVGLFVVGNIILAQCIVTIYNRRPARHRLSLLASILIGLGLLIAALGTWTGFFGPLRVGPVRVQAFSFSPAGPKARKEALAYARRSMRISRKPAVKWRGQSDTALEYTIQNKGKKEISTLVFSFRNEIGQGAPTIEASVYGPFPPQQVVKTVISVPRSVKRSYFDANDSVPVTDIVGAKF